MSRSAALAVRIGQLTGLTVREARVVGSQHGYQHLMIPLPDGRRAFAKALPPPDPAARPDRDATGSEAVTAVFAAEANGLRWLAEAAAVPVPKVLAVGPHALVISMIPPGPATPEAAFGFGTDLARLHAAGADAFGAPWPGFIAGLPLDNTPDAADWPQWYAHRRLLPFLTRAVDTGALRSEDARLVEAVIDRIGSLAGPAEPPSRIHGDCWAGPPTRREPFRRPGRPDRAAHRPDRPRGAGRWRAARLPAPHDHPVRRAARLRQGCPSLGSR